MNEKKSAIMPLALRRRKSDNFNQHLLNVPYDKEYNYLGIVFVLTLQFDITLRKSSALVREMNNYGVLKQGNLSANHRLSIWNTYFSSKLAYPLLALSLMNKTATKKVSSQIAMSVKRCLGLNQCLEKEKLYTWLYELTPKEKAEFSLLRTVKKLISADYRIENLEFFINKITSCSKEDISGYIDGKTKLNALKSKLLENRAHKEGISNGKPFETLCSSDLDWLRFSSKELDIFRWKGKLCSLCNQPLSTNHLKACMGTLKDRDDIKCRTGIEAIDLMEDPSLLNAKPASIKKSLKSYVAGRISKMIHSAGGKATL